MGPSKTDVGETLLQPDAGGGAYVVPPNLGETQVWRAGSASDEGVYVMQNQAVPVMRTSALMPCVTVDGAVRTATYGELRNMRNWIDMGSIPESVQYEPMHLGQP
jgi:hypothetical protein